MVVGDRRLERMVGLVAPAGQQPVDADRIDHRAGQDMRADLGALFQHDDGKLGIDLLQPDRGGETGRPGADDHHVELHAFAFDLAHTIPPHWLGLQALCWLTGSLAHLECDVKPVCDAFGVFARNASRPY